MSHRARPRSPRPHRLDRFGRRRPARSGGFVQCLRRQRARVSSGVIVVRDGKETLFVMHLDLFMVADELRASPAAFDAENEIGLDVDALLDGDFYGGETCL